MLSDSIAVVPDTIPHAWLRELRADRAFDYADKRPPVDIMGEIRQALMRLLQMLSGSDDTAWLIDVLLYGVIAAAVILLVWTLIKTGVMPPIMLRTGRVRALDAEVEDITEIDFERLIGVEVDSGRYRSAIRYLYLRSLRDLQDRGLLTYKRDRTNRAYARDLAGTAFAVPFSECVRVFERVWYGDTMATADDYASYATVFERLQHTMQRGEG